MFQITVKQALIVPGLDYCHIVGVASAGNARIGDVITDGISRYEITSIPFVRRNDARPADEVDICIRPGEYDPSELIGKTLYVA